MNVLIIGELNEKVISTNSIELVGKAKEISESVLLCTIGSVNDAEANIEGIECRYIKTDKNVIRNTLTINWSYFFYFWNIML